MIANIGFMQGRLCARVDGKIQAFPWDDWEVEFPVANRLGLRLMEWTLDQNRLYDNPLMTPNGQARVGELCHSYGVGIPSLTGDCFMQAPFWKVEGAEREELLNDFIAISQACSRIGIRMMVIPLVDNGRLENADQEETLVTTLRQQENFLRQHKLQILFEADLTPAELARFISRLPADIFGINYDIGNSAALGFDPVDEFAEYGSRVVNVHVKDRLRGGTTVPLGSGHAEFSKVFEQLSLVGYSGNYILQTARAENDDHAVALSRYKQLVEGWLNAF